MANDAWVEFGGREFINLSRTAQLAVTLGIDSVWTEPSEVQWVQDALSGEAYDDITAAPWYDPGYPASAEFAGLVPLSITGLDDSTLESTTVEYITSGGSSGKPRNRTLIAVANVAVVASTERGADFGKRWMDRMLVGGGAATNCAGSDLRYFRTKPQPGETAQKAHRRDVVLTRGSSVTRKRNAPCASTWLVTFTWTANDPFEYGEEIPAFTLLGGPYVLASSGGILKNPVRNPSFEIDTSGWAASANGTFLRTASSQVDGDYVGAFVSTAATINAFVNCNLVPATPGKSYTGSLSLKMQVTAASYNMQILWYKNGVFQTASSVLYSSSALSGVNFTRLRITQIAPDGVDAVKIQVSPTTALPVGSGFQIDGAMITETTDLLPFRVGSGSLTLTEQSCPVYDYTPIYDPLYPALVPSPTAPDFYPDGWTLLPGVAIQRFWARLSATEPSALGMVPVATLTAGAEARMVRVSVWPNASNVDDFCDPLWTATMTYLSPGQRFVIDGEQQAVYAWDGLSPRVRRADSLAYGNDGHPLEWPSFNDPDGLLVTLDVMAPSLGSSVRLELALVPKSD